MVRKSIKILSVLLTLAALSGCTYYTFDIKKNTILNTYKIKNSIGGDWGFYVIGDDDRFKECISNYRDTILNDADSKISNEEMQNKLKLFTFEKHRYILFYMVSDTPRKPIADKYSFSITNTHGEAVKISDTMFFFAPYDDYDKNKFDYCWLLKVEKSFTRTNFPEEVLPLELVITETPYTQAKISISF
jgi:hypothetical protein